MLEQIFYVTQNSLCVCCPGTAATQSRLEFRRDSSGLQQFDQFVAANPDQARAMLVDVIEEEFALDTIPKLGARDRTALMQRRSARKFRRTPFRLSMLQGKTSEEGNEFAVLHSAISNHELVAPWLEVILRHKMPLTGIYSVPLMAPSIVKKLFSSDNSIMFVAPHQGDKIRQVFLQGGEVRSARLSRGATTSDKDYAQFVVTELTRGRRYLERTRLLANRQVLDVCVIAEPDTAEQIRAMVDGNSQDQFQFISASAAGRILACKDSPAGDHFEDAFLSLVARKKPRQSYAANGENRYWIMQRMRNAFIGSAVTVAASCSVIAAVFISDTWLLDRRTSAIQSQVEHLSETFRRENEKFDPIKAGSNEMQLAVDSGDYLLANRVPVPWVMNQLGAVLGDYADIQVQAVRWLSDAESAELAPPPRPGGAAVPVAVHPTSSVIIELTADIEPFDGDMRSAFSRIDTLADDLVARTHFQKSEALLYPFDARTSAAVSGEISGSKMARPARFQLRFYYELPNVTGLTGRNNESG